MVATKSTLDGTCNNGSITGWSIRVENRIRFTSKLSVMISPVSDIIGRNIECAHDDYVNVTVVQDPLQ